MVILSILEIFGRGLVYILDGYMVGGYCIERVVLKGCLSDKAGFAAVNGGVVLFESSDAPRFQGSDGSRVRERKGVFRPVDEDCINSYLFFSTRIFG